MAFENLYKRHLFVGTNMSVLKTNFSNTFIRKKNHIAVMLSWNKTSYYYCFVVIQAEDNLRQACNTEMTSLRQACNMERLI